MKILHVNDRCDGRGGVERYLEDVCVLLEEHGHENVIVCCEGDGEPAVSSRRPLYRVEAEDRAGLHEALRREGPDVAYVHHVRSPDMMDTVFSALPAVAYVHGFRAVCPGLGKYFRRNDHVCGHGFGWMCFPMHYSHRCSAARDPRTVVRLMQRTARLRAAYRRAGRLLVASGYMRSLLLQNGFEAHRLVVTPPHFVRHAPEYRAPADPNCLLYAGRLEIEKGLPYLLRALAMLPQHIRLRIAGDGTQRETLEKMAIELGIERRVAFLGWLDDGLLEEHYDYCAALVMPTIAPETFGKAGIEAAVYGRPVVAFSVGGIPDWMCDGENGLLVKPADADELAERIGLLMERPAEAERMGRRGRELALAGYEPEKHIRALERAFDDAVSDGRRDG